MASHDSQGYGGRMGPRHEVDPAKSPYLQQGRPKRLIDYPRWGKRGVRRWIPSWRLVTSLTLFGIGGGALAAIAVYASVQVPDPDKSTSDQITTIYYDDGRTPIGTWSTYNRTNVTLAQIPPLVQASVLSAEDRTFYTNSGVSVTGLLRAALNNSSGGSLQGGSTITQQYVKIVLLNDQGRTVSRKVKEFVIALKISRDKPKNEILNGYLNAIYFGRGAYGIDAAAQAYFKKHVNQLTPSEGAFLAGIINGPGLYEPTDPKGLARARGRWTYVADGLVTMQKITPAQRAAMVFPTAFAPLRRNTFTGRDPQNKYLLQMVQADLLSHGFTQRQLDTGGLKIVTTFNQKAIGMAVDAVYAKLGPRKKWPAGTQVSLVSVDPASGAVRSIYAGDGTRFMNGVTQDQVQAGSTFKPFTLIAALQANSLVADGASPTATPPTVPNPSSTPDATSVTLHTRFDGHSPQTIEGFPVSNFSEEQYPKIDLIKATEDSVNTVYVQLNALIGPERTMAAAQAAGVPKAALDKNLANVLGTDYPHPIDMASAYATIAAQGVHHTPYVVSRVTYPNGGKAYQVRVTPDPVFSKDVIADVTYAMQQVVKHGTGVYARSLGRPAAGKTGTTTESKSAWFVGFTPQLSTAVAMYRIGPNGESLPLKGFQGFSDKNMTGGSLPVRVWTEYMQNALDGTKTEDFPDPAWIGGQQDVGPTTTGTASATTGSTSTATTRPTPTSTKTSTPTTSPTTTPTTSPSSTTTITIPPVTPGPTP